MNVLALMEFISSHSNYAAQVKALIEQGHCLALGAFVCFFLSYEYLNLMSQEAADGSGTPSGADLGLLNCFSVKTDRYILLPVSLGTGHNFLRYTYYTCSTYPTCSQALVGLRRDGGARVTDKPSPELRSQAQSSWQLDLHTTRREIVEESSKIVPLGAPPPSGFCFQQLQAIPFSSFRTQVQRQPSSRQ